MPTSGLPVRPEPLHLGLWIPRFPAQCRAAAAPGLRRRPFAIVRQSAAGHRCQVWSCSAAAADLGIEEGTPVYILRRSRPEVPILLRNRADEKAVADALLEIIDRHTPVRDHDGRGVALLDLTGTPAQRGEDLDDFACRLQVEVVDGTGVEDVRIGLSCSRLVAYLMAIEAAAGAVQVCPPGNEPAALADVDTAKLPGLTGACRARLQRYGLARVGQLQEISRAALASRFGREGGRLHALARGAGWTGEVARCAQPPIEVETILERDVIDSGRLEQSVCYTADRVCHELECRDAILTAMRMVLRYSDGRRRQRTVVLPRPTQAFAAIAATAVSLFNQLNECRIAVRSITICAGRIQTDTCQADLFDGDGEGRQRALGRSIAAIRRRSGFGAILPAATLPVYQSDLAARAGSPPGGSD